MGDKLKQELPPGHESVTAQATPPHAFSNLEVSVAGVFLSVILNFAITLILIALEKRRFKSRLSQERDFQAGNYLFQQLVAAKFVDFMTAVQDAEKLYHALIEKLTPLPDPEHRVHIEFAVDSLERLNEGFSHKTLALITLVSPQLYSHLDKSWEKFCDICTTCLSNGMPLGAKPKKNALETIAKARAAFVASVVQGVGDYRKTALEGKKAN